MPERCVVFGCSNTRYGSKAISIHRIPFFGDDRPEAKRRRKKWVDFVSLHRKKWTPSKASAICADHFKPEDYAKQFTFLEDQSARLLKDDIGIVAVPTIFKPVETPSSDRTRRKIVKEALKSGQAQPTSRSEEIMTESSATCASDDLELEASLIQDSVVDETPSLPTDTPMEITLAPSASENCLDCEEMKKKQRHVRNLWISAREKLRKCRAELAKQKDRCDCDQKVKKNKKKENLAIQADTVPGYEKKETEDEIEDEDEDDERNDEQEEIMEEEPTDEYITEEETETATDTDEETNERVYIKDNNMRTEPKFILFLSQLLLLFQYCRFCKASNPLVEAKAIGTMVEVSNVCTNPECRKEFTWRSQPSLPGTKIPAGNFLLCFAILLAGGSASKVLQMFAHMGLSCFSLNTFFEHQRNILFPSIHLYWKEYQRQLIERLKTIGSGLVIAGDGRHDSMGHSAKYCGYTVFCCTLPVIIHFVVVQRNQAGSSPAMEYLAFQRCMTFMLATGLAITTFISDRHTSIVKHMRERLKNVIHYFDLWHLKKKINKVLTKISKESGCEAVSKWIRPCTNHFYWSALSTRSGNGELIWAKFKSFLSHMINNHDKLDHPLFKKCAHDANIAEREWLKKDSAVYEKVYKVLTNPRLVTAIKKASPLEQTSSLEGFHSVLNHFAPKMIGYSFSGMYCRHIVAALHFNSNLHREIRTTPDGGNQVAVVYPKFKNGEATVRDVKVKAKFEYVEEIYQTVLKSIRDGKLKDAMKDLKDMTPPPMNRMLERQSREEAISKREARKSMDVVDVPATSPVPEAVPDTESTAATTGTTKVRNKPHCSVCKNPMKGHKYVDCPKNQEINPQ